MSNILIVDDNESIREGLAHIVRKLGHTATVAASGEQGVAAFTKGTVDFVISDLKMEGMDGVEVLRRVRELDPDVPGMIVTAFGTVETAVEAMKLGAFDFITKPFAREVVELKIARALELVAGRRAQRKLEAKVEYFQEEAEKNYAFAELIGSSEGMARVFRTVERVARTDSSVFISGESGTGKELVARAIHRLSGRAEGPFIKVNCGAIAETLLESELFGHERGAFTGAIKRKLGRFELASGGTLFLDELGDIPASMQVKLLRALQEQEIERVGGETTISIDTRIVSATNKNLQQEVESGRFREDLFYRIHVVPVELPPLRERRDDIPDLVVHFISKLGPKINPEVRRIDDGALARLVAYNWPGNVRELENVIEQSLVFAEGDVIAGEALPAFLRSDREDRLDIPKSMSLPEILDDLERQLIVKAFKKAGGVKTETARLLGIKPSALYYKLDKYKLS